MYYNLLPSTRDCPRCVIFMIIFSFNDLMKIFSDIYRFYMEIIIFFNLKKIHIMVLIPFIAKLISPSVELETLEDFIPSFYLFRSSLPKVYI